MCASVNNIIYYGYACVCVWKKEQLLAVGDEKTSIIIYYDEEKTPSVI